MSNKIKSSSLDSSNKDSKYSVMGVHIKERLKAKKLSIRELAQITHISLPSINNILYGYTENPSVHAIKQIADALECTVDELLEEEKKQPIQQNIKRSEEVQKEVQAADLMKNFSISSEDKLALIKEIQLFIKKFCESKQLSLSEEERRQAALEILKESLSNLSPEGKPMLDKLFGELVLSVY